MTTYVHPPSFGLFSSVALNPLFKRAMLRISRHQRILPSATTASDRELIARTWSDPIGMSGASLGRAERVPTRVRHKTVGRDRRSIGPRATRDDCPRTRIPERRSGGVSERLIHE
jgi:hypothetical protein